MIRSNVLVKSITADNGIEFGTLGIIAKNIGVKSYKCDSYCSFRRESDMLEITINKKENHLIFLL